jgi:hypothetical protein
MFVSRMGRESDEDKVLVKEGELGRCDVVR